MSRLVHSVWTCRWCGLEYEHPITGAVAAGHWCDGKLRTLTRTARSRYDEISASERPRSQIRTVGNKGPVSRGSVSKRFFDPETGSGRGRGLR